MSLSTVKTKCYYSVVSDGAALLSINTDEPSDIGLREALRAQANLELYIQDTLQLRSLLLTQKLSSQVMVTNLEGALQQAWTAAQSENLHPTHFTGFHHENIPIHNHNIHTGI